jgi:folate-binding protein YgfZ
MDASKCFSEYQPAAHFMVTGEDAADFLQSQFSNDLRPFQPGQCCYGLWLDVKAKVIADSVVICEGEESFRVLSERCSGELIVAHLERHIIADEVELQHCPPAWGMQCMGPGTSAGAEWPAVGQCLPNSDGFIFAARAAYFDQIFFSKPAFEAARTALSTAGFRSATENERGLVRISAGIPLVPIEIGAADLPGEGELELDAISFNKGCYLGQEVVARMHNIGKPQRRLFVVEGHSSERPQLPCALLNAGSKQVGELRSAYSLGDGWRGVAILKTRFAEVGGSLYFDNEEFTVVAPLREGLEYE